MANQFAKIPWQVALDSRLTLREIRVLIAILSFASDGKAFPKREQIAARCGMLTERVTKVTTSLVKKGWLIKTDGRGQKSSHYELTLPNLDEIQKTASKRPDQPSPKTNQKVVNLTTFEAEIKGGQSDHVKGGQSDHLKGGQSDHLSFLIDQTTYQTIDQTMPVSPVFDRKNGVPHPPKKEPSAGASGRTQREGDESPDNGFEDFWLIYPKRCNKNAARAAWHKLNPPPDLAREIVRHITERMERDEQWTRDSGKGIPYPANFLNQRRWEDEYFVREPTREERNDMARKQWEAIRDYEATLRRNHSEVPETAVRQFIERMRAAGASREDISAAERDIRAKVQFGF